MSSAEDDLQGGGQSFVSQSDSESDSLTEQAYEARFSRSNAPSPASDIGLMGNGSSEPEDRSGSLGNFSDEGAEYTEDEEVEVFSIGGSVSSVEAEVTVQDLNEPNGSVVTVKLPRVEGSSSGNTVLKFSLSLAESYTPAVEVVIDDENDEGDEEEPQADLAPVDGPSSDNTVLEPSLSPVENITAVEVVDEETWSTTPPISPCTTLNTLRTILEDPNEDEEPQESSSIPSSSSDNLSDTTAPATPTPVERSDHEGQDTLATFSSEAILRPDAQPEDEDVAELVESPPNVSQGMQGSLETPVAQPSESVQTPDSPSWKVVGQKGKGKATPPTTSLGLGASIWAKQQPSSSSLGFSNLECAEGESDRDDETGNKDKVDLNEPSVVNIDQGPDADDEREGEVADAEGQGSRKGKSRSRGHSWWMKKQPQDNHRNRGTAGWGMREAKRAREAAAQRQVNAESSTTCSRGHGH
ncbi:hypothetical protein EST38_g2657 [Candolleomyces aberdarensis]|uniref:Uncharacterized protein n=1 Tax=Candolleomyces aberdarensis TaxID=2316362 RepID=A0A4Q2DW99_9AGAR|nr:hypothetical protein EST38_g2657 [Candolleomyces aberdarensis]